jgi:hypothetical protein
MRPGALLYAVAASALALVAVGFGCGAFGSDNAIDAPPDAASDGVAVEAGSPGDGADAGAEGGDAGTSTTDPGVFCQTKYCAPGAEICCKTLPGGGAGCVPPDGGAAVCPGISFACDDNADCPTSTVCCGSLNSAQTEVFGTTCLPLMDCKKVNFYAVVCDPSATTPCSVGPCIVPDGGGYGFCKNQRFDAP